MTHPYLTEWRESRPSEWRETDLAERVTLGAPELRPCNQVAAVPTSTGLLIGCNYRRPMPQPSADAERIQSALLAKDRPSRDGWKFWLAGWCLSWLLAAPSRQKLKRGATTPQHASRSAVPRQPVAEASRIWTTASHSPTRSAAVHCALLPEVGHPPMKARN